MDAEDSLGIVERIGVASCELVAYNACSYSITVNSLDGENVLVIW